MKKPNVKTGKKAKRATQLLDNKISTIPKSALDQMTDGKMKKHLGKKEDHTKQYSALEFTSEFKGKEYPFIVISYQQLHTVTHIHLRAELPKDVYNITIVDDKGAVYRLLGVNSEKEAMDKLRQEEYWEVNL